MATKEKYFEAVGRRKTAIARVRITPAKSDSFTVNEKTVADYFATPALQKMATEGLTKPALDQKFSVSVKILGGGTSSQAEAVRLGIARALIKYNEGLRADLKHEGFLKRDPREKERRKFGLKKARKAPQWSKR